MRYEFISKDLGQHDAPDRPVDDASHHHGDADEAVSACCVTTQYSFVLNVVKVAYK